MNGEFVTDAEVDALTHNHALGEDRPASAANGSNADGAPADPRIDRKCDGQRLGGVKPPHGATESGPSGVAHRHTETPCGSVVVTGSPGVEARPAITAGSEVTDEPLPELHTNEKWGGRGGTRPPYRTTDGGPIGGGHRHTDTLCGLVVRAGSPSVEARPPIAADSHTTDDAPADPHPPEEYDGRRKGTDRPPNGARNESPLGMGHGHTEIPCCTIVAANHPAATGGAR